MALAGQAPVGEATLAISLAAAVENATSCCLPAPPCGDLRCHGELSAEACRVLARASSPLRLDPLQCARSAQDLPEWEDVVFPFVYLPSAAFLGLSLLWAVLSVLYDCLNLRSSRFIANHIGTCHRPNPQSPRFINVLNALQIVSSLGAMSIFVVNSYTHSVSLAARRLETWLGVFFAFHFLVSGLRNEFRPSSLLRAGQIVDVLTVPAMLLLCAHSLGGASLAKVHWLSLNFLRSVQALLAYEELNRMGAMRKGGEEGLLQGLLSMALRFVTLIMCFSSSVLVLEILGELPSARESEMVTGMGNISFFTMLYWIVETITTVGYGDYHPTTWLSRSVTTLLMITGFAFLGVEMERIYSIMSRRKKFAGSYKQTSRRHVVLVGGGVQQADELLLLAFLEELFHMSYRSSWPDLVIMCSEVDSVEQVQEIISLQLPWEARQQILYLAGSPLSEADLLRAHCDSASVVFVISDTTGAKDPADEDKENLMRALSVRHTFPLTPLKLMLLMQDSRERAFSVGIPPQICFAMNEMKDSLFWQACRCKGWNTLLCNLMITTDTDEIDEAEFEDSPWLHEYVLGMGHEVYGFLPNKKFHGKTLQFITLEAYRQSGILILAAQIDGRIEPAPLHKNHVIHRDTVLFSLCQDESDLKDWALPSDRLDWRKVFEHHSRNMADQATAEYFRRLSSRTLSDVGVFHTAMAQKASKEDELGMEEQSEEEEARQESSDAGGRGGAEEGERNAGRSPSSARSWFFSSILLGSRSCDVTSGHSGDVPSSSPDALASSMDTSEVSPLPLELGGGGDSRPRGANLRLSWLDEEVEGEDVNEVFYVSESTMPRKLNSTEMLTRSVSSFAYQPELVANRVSQALEQRAQAIRSRAAQAPFVLLLDQSKSWFTIVPFLVQSRSEYLPFHMPIIVLTDTAPPLAVAEHMTFEEDDGLGVVLGSSNWAPDLIRAGVHECSIIVCLGGGSGNHDLSREMVAMLDADVIMLQRMLQGIGVSGKAMIFEFKRTANMRLLPQLEPRVAPSAAPSPVAELLPEVTDTVRPLVPWLQTRDSSREMVPRGQVIAPQTCWRRLFQCCCWRRRYAPAPDYDYESKQQPQQQEAHSSEAGSSKGAAAEGGKAKEKSFYLDPRFAAGEIFSPHFLGALLAHAFYTPGVVEVMQALVVPKEDEEGPVPWQTHVRPEDVGRTFGEVFADLVQDPETPVLPLGMLRMLRHGVKPYVWTNPSADTRLTTQDLLFVVGDRKFGQMAFERGMLPLSGRHGDEDGSSRTRWTLTCTPTDGSGGEGPGTPNGGAKRRWGG